MALKWHPDRNQQSEEQKQKADKMFKDVNEAYKVLSDPNERRRYDMGAYDADIGGGFGGGGSFSTNIDPNEIFNMFFSQSGGGGTAFMSGGGRSGGMGGMPNLFSFGSDDEDMLFTGAGNDARPGVGHMGGFRAG